MPHQRRLNPGQEVRKNLELLLCEVEERLAHHGDEILPRGSTKSRQVGPVPALGDDVVGSLHNGQDFDDCRRTGINQEREREPLSSQANSDPVKHHHILTAGEALEHVAEMAHLGVRLAGMTRQSSPIRSSRAWPSWPKRAGSPSSVFGPTSVPVCCRFRWYERFATAPSTRPSGSSRACRSQDHGRQDPLPNCSSTSRAESKWVRSTDGAAGNTFGLCIGRPAKTAG